MNDLLAFIYCRTFTEKSTDRIDIYSQAHPNICTLGLKTKFSVERLKKRNVKIWNQSLLSALEKMKELGFAVWQTLVIIVVFDYKTKSLKCKLRW